MMDQHFFSSTKFNREKHDDSKKDKIIRMLLEIKEEIREIKDVVQDLSKKVDNLERRYEVPLAKIHLPIDSFSSNMIDMTLQ